MTTPQLIELVRKSALLDEDRLGAFLAAIAGQMPEQPKAFAELLIRNRLLTVFQASQLLSGKWKGFFIAGGKYKLLELLGVGGMGKVYLCEHRRMKRLVAIKVLPTDRLKDPACIVRFEREARAVGALDHPNIVRAFDLDQDGELHFIVMEYVDGSTLNEIVKRFGPLGIERACHYISQAAEGLQHAHEAAGLVHRDVKPGNLLLDRSGTVKLLDMGLARFFHDDAVEALTKRHDKSAVLGTADYLAPEQVVDSSEVDIRADIYSLGATFYFLLVGRSPFERGSVSEKLLWHQHREPPPIRSLRPEVPPELESIVATMMAKKVNERFQSPMEVVEALRPWTDQPIDLPESREMPRLCPAIESLTPSIPVSTGPGSSSSVRLRKKSGPRIPRSSRRSVSPATLLAGFVAFVLFIGGLIWWSQTPIDSKATPPLNIPRQAGTGVFVGELPGPDALPSAENGTLFVTRDPRRTIAAARRTDIVPTLGEALARVEPSGKVVVLDGPVEGQLRVDGARVGGIAIEGRGDGGSRIVWSPPENARADQPLLTLVGAESARITGFEFDGRQKVNLLVRVEGNAAGVHIDRCWLTDASQSAIELRDAVAPEQRPVTIEHCRFTTERGYHVAGNIVVSRAIHLMSRNATSPAVAVRQCRVEGRFLAGIQLDSPGQLEVRLNRFFVPAMEEENSHVVAVRWSDRGPVKLRLESNTAAGFASMLRLDRMPPSASGSTFLLRSNLMVDGDAFVTSSDVADVIAAKAMFAGSLGNVSRPECGNGGLSVLEKVSVAFPPLDTDPASPRFLRYAKSGATLPLFTAGSGGEPAGVPPGD